jgi:hypothetical protein
LPAVVPGVILCPWFRDLDPSKLVLNRDRLERAVAATDAWLASVFSGLASA